METWLEFFLARKSIRWKRGKTHSSRQWTEIPRHSSLRAMVSDFRHPLLVDTSSLIAVVNIDYWDVLADALSLTTTNGCRSELRNHVTSNTHAPEGSREQYLRRGSQRVIDHFDDDSSSWSCVAVVLRPHGSAPPTHTGVGSPVSGIVGAPAAQSIWGRSARNWSSRASSTASGWSSRNAAARRSTVCPAWSIWK